MTTKLDIAKAHCCNWHKDGCVFDEDNVCEPDKCKHWPVVEATAARAAGKPRKGG